MIRIYFVRKSEVNFNSAKTYCTLIHNHILCLRLHSSIPTDHKQPNIPSNNRIISPSSCKPLQPLPPACNHKSKNYHHLPSPATTRPHLAPSLRTCYHIPSHVTTCPHMPPFTPTYNRSPPPAITYPYLPSLTLSCHHLL